MRSKFLVKPAFSIFRSLLPLLLFSLLAASCAQTYRGPLPNMYLQEPAAKQLEVHRFTINQGFWSGTKMAETRYHLRSLTPVIEHVSPSGSERVERGRTLDNMGAALQVAGVIGLIYGADAGNSLTTIGALAWGGGIGLSLYGQSQISDGITRYNADLRQRLGAWGHNRQPLDYERERGFSPLPDPPPHRLLITKKF